MANESINVPITSNLLIPDGVRSRSSEGKLIATKSRATKQTDPRRASTGSFRSEGKKIPSGKPSPLNNGESLVPHYLRASTGSCHDFCKYGKKHETEVKQWQAKARKVIKPMLNQQTNSESGDLSENKITKVVKPKPHLVLKTKSPNFTAVSGKTISSSSNESTIPSRSVSAKGKIVIANEKKKNVLKKRNTPLLSGKRESETKPDQTNETSNEATRNLVSFPVVQRAIKPSCNGVSSLKVNVKRGKKLVSPFKDQNKIVKIELQRPSDNTAEEKTLHVIKVEGKNAVPESRDKNQEGIKEVKNELIENKNLTGEALPVFEVDSKKLVPELEHNENTFYPPSFESFLSPSISSPVLSNNEEEAQDDVEYIDRHSGKKASESKQNEKSFDSLSSDLFSSPNIPDSIKSPALLSGEEEAQDVVEYIDSQKNVPKSKQNGSTFDSPPSDSISSPNIPFLVKSPALSYGEEESQDEEGRNPESKQKEHTIGSSPSESFSSLNIPSLVNSLALSYGEEESQDVLEYTNGENEIPELKQNKSNIDSSPSESFSSPSISSAVPVSLYSEEETKNELEYTNNEKKVSESENNKRIIDYISSELSSSPNMPSPVKPPAVLYVDEVHDEVVYLDSEIDGSDDSISQSSEILNSDEEETSVGDQNNITRKAKIVSEKDDPARKLKFRRGKVIEIESNNSGPRRLKFRKAKFLCESQDNALKSHRRGYEKGGVDDMDGTKDDSEKIVLRHQQVEGKKDAEGLFNNVIEETASKLAETRKSKVKALVGAFETVISLQESKPSTQNGF